MSGFSIATVVAGSSSGQTVQVEDIGLQTGFQDTFLGHHKKGRALVVADFNLDGRPDIYVGNPGDESFVALNVPEGETGYRFELVQVLASSGFNWGASSADYDNDGDYDLYISVGGNEGVGFDRLFKNLWLETGGASLQFEDVTSVAGIAGPTPPGAGAPIPVASSNGIWGDYNLDGWIDLFVSVNVHATSLSQIKGRNVLWINNGDGTFANLTASAGLHQTSFATQNSTALDFDNDGDVDLYESNNEAPNVLWRNALKETGSLTFDDVTLQMSAPGESLKFPLSAFASTTGDFNNDGWLDMMVFRRHDFQEPGSPYPPGHAIFMNVVGEKFRNMAGASGINKGFAPIKGVMGCQIGDLNGDSVPDVLVGNGGPFDGEADDLFFSDSQFGKLPHYQDASSLVDFAAPEGPGPVYPEYPYRTHGTVMADFDGDGLLELGVANGGMLLQPNAVREPNRLFRFDLSPRPSWLKVRPVGNGTSVSRDAIGARIEVTARVDGGPARTHHGTLLGASAFSAQSGFEVFFGLDQADVVESLRVRWPDGSEDTIAQGLTVDTSLVLFQDCASANCLCTVTEAPESTCADGVDNDCDGFSDLEDPDCAPPSGGAKYHMNAAGPAYSSSFGVFFEADRPFQPGDFGFVNGKQTKVEFEIAGTADEDLYQAMRWGKSVRFWVDDVESATYEVTMHFAEPIATAAGKRVFDVLAEGVVAVDDLDVFAAAGGRRRAHSESFVVTVTDGRLEIELQSVKGELLMTSAVSVVPVG